MNTALIIATLIFGNARCEGTVSMDADYNATVTFDKACSIKLTDCLHRATVDIGDGVERETMGCAVDMSSADFDMADLAG